MRKNKEIAQLLKNAIEGQDTDAIWFAIGELEKNQEDYNGWSNRETWATALHIDNNQGLQEQASKIICDSFLSDIDTEREDGYLDGLISAEDNLAECVEDIISDGYWDGAENMPADVAMMKREIGSLWRVNFREIAESWLSDEIEKFKAGGYKEEAGE